MLCVSRARCISLLANGYPGVVKQYCFFTVSEDDVVLADKFCERSYNDKIHLVIAIDFTATRQIIRQLHDSLISFDRAI